jgi:adenylosuccinate lyase
MEQQKKPKISNRVNRFDMVSPTDYRYLVPQLVPYLSEEAFIKYKSKVEAGLARTWARWGFITEESAERTGAAAEKVTACEVYEEEEKTHHDVIAQVNRIRSKLRGKENREARGAVHRPATSYDIIDTANAMRFRDAFLRVIIPDMIALERAWIKMARDYKNMLQIGRTHLQHAEPITFGFAMASFVRRFGGRILTVKLAVDGLEGKFSGAVGTYSAASLFVSNPVGFEREVLAQVGIKPTQISTQITPPEQIVDLNHSVNSSFGVLTSWATDMYHLQRPEIAEVGQPGRGSDVSRSSVMPHKANPVGAENIISLWKETMPHMITLYLDQISLHQRDLTNSATSRYNPEVYQLFDYAVRRAIRVTKSIVPNPRNMLRNFELASPYIVAEPLQLLLSSLGHPNAHEAVGKLADQAREQNIFLMEVVNENKGMRKYLRRFTPEQKEILGVPSKYLGAAGEKVVAVADYWDTEMASLEEQLGQGEQKG